MNKNIIVLHAASRTAEVEEQNKDEEVRTIDSFIHNQYTFPPLPIMQPHQQTLRRGFTLAGVGLHTGGYCTVRVRPAPAGTGRFIAILPAGTNQSRYVPGFDPDILPDPQNLLPPISKHGIIDDEGYIELTVEEEERQLQYYIMYLETCEKDNYRKPFHTFLLEKQLFVLDQARLPSDRWITFDPDFEYAFRDFYSESQVIDLSGYTLLERNMFDACLTNGSYIISGWEPLLSVLEACGVDNVCIEVEGAQEFPVLDGTACKWVTVIQAVGLQSAPFYETALKVTKDVRDLIYTKQQIEHGEGIDPELVERFYKVKTDVYAVYEETMEAILKEQQQEREKNQPSPIDQEVETEGNQIQEAQIVDKESDQDEEKENKEEDEIVDVEDYYLEDISIMDYCQKLQIETNYYGEQIYDSKDVRRFKRPIVAQAEGGYINYIPSESTDISCGLTRDDCDSVGTQWYTFKPFEDLGYKNEVSMARTWVSLTEFYVQKDMDMLQAGTRGKVLIASKDGWMNKKEVTYIDEPARHLMQRMIGLLGLLGDGNTTGIPQGHIVAYNPSRKLMIRFLQQMMHRIEKDDFEAISFRKIRGLVEPPQQYADSRDLKAVEYQDFNVSRQHKLAGKKLTSYEELFKLPFK